MEFGRFVIIWLDDVLTVEPCDTPTNLSAPESENDKKHIDIFSQRF